MEERRRAPGAARTRPSSGNSSLSLLQRLQSENENLRFELLQSHQRNVSLQHQLDSLHASVDQNVKDAVAANKEQMRALEERCRLLADRVVASKRDGQLSESARVGFLLRSQLEERRFLKRGLEAMLESLRGRQASVLPEAAEGTEEEVHTGTLYRLVMAASNALLEHTAAVKLAKARTRLSLEHATAVLSELHNALRDAARATFEAVAHASSLEETLLAGGDRDAPQASTMLSRGTAFSTLRSGFATPSPYRRELADSSAKGGENEGNDVSRTVSSANWTAAPAAWQLSEELEWVCDVLKACVQGVREVDGDLAAAGAELTAPQPSPPSSPLQQRPAVNGSIESSKLHKKTDLPPLAEAASPEMNDLLRSFLADLSDVKKRAAQQQEAMARQLAHEVDRHYRSTQQYEERVKLLETECARLLRHAERVSEERAKPLSDLPATAVAPASQHQPHQQRPSSSSQHDTAGAPSNATQKAVTAVEDTEEDESHRVTPERYAVKRRDTSSAAPRSLAECSFSTLPTTATPDSNMHGSSRPLRSAPGKRHARDAASQAGGPDISRGRSGIWNESTPAQHEGWPSHSLLKEVSPNYRLDYSTNKSLLSPRRGTPPHAASGTPSAAAASLRSLDHSRNASVQGESSAVADRFALQRRYRRLMSPAPLPVSSPQPSVPSGWSGMAAVHAAVLTATPISSVSSTSERFSSPRPRAKSTHGLVSSQVRSRGSALLSSPDAVAVAAETPERAQTPLAMTGWRSPAASSPHAPPRDVSVSSSPSAHSVVNRTRLSQQQYDEAAADVFHSDSKSFLDDAASPTFVQQQQQHMRSHSLKQGDESPEVRQPSPRRPMHFEFSDPHGIAQDAASLPQEEHLPFTSPSSPRPLPSPPPHRIRVWATTAGKDAEAPQETTPPLWRRMKEEASLQQQQMPSPIAGASDLFGTPPEASWIDS